MSLPPACPLHPANINGTPVLPANPRSIVNIVNFASGKILFARPDSRARTCMRA